MLPKWTFLFVVCVWTVFAAKIPYHRTKAVLRKFKEEKENVVKLQVHKMLEEINTKKALDNKSTDGELSFDVCIEVLYDRINRRKLLLDSIMSKLKNVWLSSTLCPASSIEVKGKIISTTNSTVISLKLSTHASSSTVLQQMKTDLLNITFRQEVELSKLLLKSVDQDIRSNLRFTDITVKNSNGIQLSKHVNINNLPTHRLHYALRRKGDQVFARNLTVLNANCTNAATTRLNSYRMEDYALLRPGRCFMPGYTEFGGISAVNVYVRNTMNGVKLENIVLTNSTQNISGQKTFESLTARSIKTTDNSWDQIYLFETRGMVYRNSNIDFVSTLNVEGDLNVSLLNGERVNSLYFGTVKKNERGNIGGHKKFKSLEVRGDVSIQGGINDVPLMNLMTVHADQNITAAVAFSNVTFHKDVRTGLLNGIYLTSEAAAKSSPYLKVRGVKTFKENVYVSNVTMENGTLLDSFDPSVETYEMMNVADKTQRIHRFKHGVIVGNVEAENVRASTYDLPHINLLNNVWLRTTDQHIPILQANTIRVKNLNVSKVNGIPMEDFVVTSEEDSFNTTIEFNEMISTHSLMTRNGSNINFSPEFWNPDVQVKVGGSIHIKNATLERNLSVKEGIESLDFMSLDAFQTVKGELSFTKINLKDLTLSNLTVDKLNNFNIPGYFERSNLSSMHIFNKKFSILKGRDKMTCDGTINGVKLDTVMTTNTHQKLNSSYRFLNPASFLMNVDVKKFFGRIRLEDVVYTDGTGNISNKYFRGNVSASNANASGEVQGVDIKLLEQEAFNKNKHYNMSHKWTFRGNLSAGEFRVAKNRSVDNVCFENLIRLNEYVTLRNFNASSIKANNVQVEGKVNGCELQSVYQNALWRKKDAQNITGKIHFTNLKINGTLQAEYCNGAYLPDWIELFKILKVDEGNDVIFENVTAESLHIPGSVNNVSVVFMLKDYVQKNGIQEITGKKRFRGLKVNNMSADTVEVSEMCGIRVSDLYQYSVSRSNTNNTLVMENRTLAGLNASRILVKGRMNGLKIPEDVILSNSDDIIEGEVSIEMLNATAGLNASRINGVELDKFVESRISLNENQNISSEIVFHDDSTVEGNCTIHQRITINDIRLEDIVNRVQKQAITGKKYFAGGDLEVMSNVTVKGSVNRLSLDHLQKSLALRYGNEHFKGVVNFSSINASSLVCRMINGFDFFEQYNSTHLLFHYIDDQLINFTARFNSHQDLMNKLISTEDSLLLYKSFELHRMIDFGIIERFLPVYEFETHGPKYELEVMQMVMWVKEEDSREAKSVIADVMEDGSFNLSKKMEGKVFPFVLSVPNEDVAGFYVQALRCSGKECIIITALSTSGERKNATIAPPGNGTVTDVQLLEVDEEIFLLLSFANTGSSERIFVYRYEIANNIWKHHQRFHSQELTSVSMIDLEIDAFLAYESPRVYLAVTGDERSPGVTVYQWDFGEFMFMTNMSTSVSTHVTWVYHDRAVYLLLAKEMDTVRKENNVSVNNFNEPLEVYTLEEDLSLNHTVNVKGASFLEPFGFAEEAFVLATSKHLGKIYVLQLRGYNGFELVQEILSPGVTETRVFTANNHLYLAINSRTRVLKSKNTEGAGSRILKASQRGRRRDTGTKEMRMSTSKLFV